MICSSINRFFTSNLLRMGIGLQTDALLKTGGTSQVQGVATRWLWTYNHERPNMALGGITPMQKLVLAA
jgi:hypothetical protein